MHCAWVFRYDEAMAAVAKALPNVEAVIVLTDMSIQTFPAGALLGNINVTEYTDTVQHYQYQALKPLLTSPHAAKVKIFSLGLPGAHRDADHQIYVHSKVRRRPALETPVVRKRSVAVGSRYGTGRSAMGEDAVPTSRLPKRIGLRAEPYRRRDDKRRPRSSL